MKVRHWLALGLVAVAAAVLGPVSPAFGLTPGEPGVEVKSPATLLNKGAAVAVSFDVVCAGGGSIGLSITQRVGAKTLAQGFLFASFACTGDVQRVVVTAATQQVPFRKGPAFVTAALAHDAQRLAVPRAVAH